MIIICGIGILTSIGAWINTKIILDEIDSIKKHLGIPEPKRIDYLNLSDDLNDNDDKKEK